MTSDLIRLSALLDDARCFDLIRRHRWPDGVRCPSCDSGHVVRNGWDDARHTRWRRLCKACKARFDDLTGTVLAGHHQPLREPGAPPPQAGAVPVFHGPQPVEPADHVGGDAQPQGA